MATRCYHEVAEGGGTELELQAVFGWKTNSQSAVYTRNAKRAGLAKSGMAKRSKNNSIPAPSTQIPAPKKRKAESNG